MQSNQSEVVRLWRTVKELPKAAVKEFAKDESLRIILPSDGIAVNS